MTTIIDGQEIDDGVDEPGPDCEFCDGCGESFPWHDLTLFPSGDHLCNECEDYDEEL